MLDRKICEIVWSPGRLKNAWLVRNEGAFYVQSGSFPPHLLFPCLFRKYANMLIKSLERPNVYCENQNVWAVVIIIIDILISVIIIISENHCYCHHYCHHHQVWRHHLAASVGGNEEYWPLCSIRIFPDAFHSVIIIILLSYIIIDVITVIIISLTSFFVQVFVSP